MDVQTTIQTVIGAGVPAIAATAYITSRLSVLDEIKARMTGVENRLDKLDSTRESVAVIPHIVERLRIIESAIFRHTGEK